MPGLASKINAGLSVRRLRFCRGACLTWPHVKHARGTTKARADWVFVSGVSPVSPNLELIEDHRMGKRDRQRQALIGALPPTLRQVRPAQQPRGFQGETTRHGRDR